MRRMTPLLGTALLFACNIDTLTQDFLDKYTRDTETGTGTSTGPEDPGEGSSTATPGDGSESRGEGSTAAVDASSSSSEGGVVMTDTGDTASSSDTTGAPALCGDGILEGDEECDDPGDTKCYKCVRDRIVFITSEQVQGDFSYESLASLDYWCNHLAAVQGLLTNNQPRFKTWVSTSQESAAERIFHSPGRYVLMNGLVFAESWDALMAGQILNPLNVDEKSEKGKSGAFTDTRPDGTAMPGTHCDDWQSDSENTLAYFGSNVATDSSWTLYVGGASNPLPCGLPRTLYCFESP